MKVIDLLNMISKGEKVPKYVVYYNMLKDKTDTMMVCKESIFYKLDQLEIQLNSRVEVIEEEPRDIEVCGSLFTRSEYNRLAGIKEDKKIEKITLLGEEIKLGSLSNWLKDCTINEEKIASCIECNAMKINEIIDYILEDK